MGALALKCFYHHDRDALGTCKACGKGLCADCLEDFDKGLACRGRCEEDVRRLLEYIDYSVRSYVEATRVGRAWFFLMATVLIVLGAILLAIPAAEHSLWYVAVPGGMLVGLGLLIWVRGWLWPKWSANRNSPRDRP